MRRPLAFVALISVTALSCSRNPESIPTGPTAADVAVSTAAGSHRAANWACAAAGASTSTDGPWRIETPACESVAVRSVASAAAASPVFAPGPSNYRATVVGTNVRLEWDQSPGSYGWQIEAGSAPGLANLAVLRTAPSTLGTTATQIFDVANVPPGRYFSRVRSGPPNFSDLSLPSNEIEVVVGSTCGAAPSAPTGFVASVAGSGVTLNWTGPAGQSVSSYLLEVGSAAGLSNLLVFDTGSAATSLAATAAPGIYFARLRSRNACGTGAPTPDLQVVVGGGQPPPPTACGVSVSPPSQTVSTAGSTFDIQVSTAGNCQWQASLNVPWLSFGSGTSGQGNGTVRVNAAANSGGGRNGRVTITTSTASAATDVAQGGTTACSYSVSPTNFNVIAAGGSVTANVTATPGCAWTSASSSGFVTISSGTSGTGNGSVVLQVANNSGSARNGSARVSWVGGGQDLSVAQSGAASVPPTAAFSASPDPCLLSNNGNTLNCSFNGSASSAGSGTIVAWVWQYLNVNQEESSPTHSPTAFTNCGIGQNQQVAVPVTLRVRNSAGVLSSPVQQTVTLRRQGACGF